MRHARFRQADGWEGFCPGCRSWWPIDLEYWPAQIRGGLCRACFLEFGRERARDRRKDPVKRNRNVEYVRAYRASRTPVQKAAESAKRREWRLAHVERLREKQRAYHAANRAKHNAYARAYRRRKHLEALMQDRAA